jgi:hypothetical protein
LADTEPHAERTDTCGEYAASTTFPDGDSEREHTEDAHDGKEVSGWVREPNPFFDRD